MSARIVICGVGAIGSHTAVLLRNIAAELCFVDFDRVESKNLMAQAFVKQSVGKNKADALKLQLHNFYGIKSQSFGVRLGSDNVVALLGGAALAIDCFDNASSRRILSGHSREAALPLVHAGVAGDGSFGICRWDERFVPDEEDTPGAATCEGGAHLPLLGALAAALARIVQDFLKDGERRDAMVTLTEVTSA